MKAQNQTPWRSNEFKLGVNMAGAVSAGAYTAGVLDFLLEALEEWEKAKTAFREHLANPSVPAVEPVPLHDVTIEAFGGASAGGMCAAIGAVMVQQEFEHIRSAMETGTTNTLYEGWVNQIDIAHLLDTRDMAKDRPLVSLLDSTIIDEIAQMALEPKGSLMRSYVSKHLTLVLTLTNVRGTPYRLYSDPTANGSAGEPTVDEYTAYYGDRLRFEITGGDESPAHTSAKALPANKPGKGAWPLLEEAAKATGAFPIMLAPRRLTRDKADYVPPIWETGRREAGDGTASPDWPEVPPTWETLNVDGGVTDNNPFQLMNDVLLGLQEPPPANGKNPSEAVEANCAVVTVAPFPATQRFDHHYNAQSASGIWTMAGRLLDVLISQSRFMGESLSELTEGAAFNRFVVAPSDPKQAQGSALQCGLLNAFGGFFHRGFRRHDFLLGRRNCQRFLQAHFRLPEGNRVIAEGLNAAGVHAEEIRTQYGFTPSGSASSSNQRWIPLIPLLGTALHEVPAPAREKMPEANLKRIVDQVIRRARAIGPLLLADAPRMVRWLAAIVLRWPFSLAIRGPLLSTLVGRLGDNIETE